jgi:DNA methylase
METLVKHATASRVPVSSPLWSTQCTTGEDCTFQQLAPYIGRIKTSIARSLIERYTNRGDIVVDPFAGSGVIPFEAALLGRRPVATDTSPYGVLLMRAKFSAPADCTAALAQFSTRWQAAQRRRRHQDLRHAPAWVRKFFHPETLRSALALRDELIHKSDHFLMACLLGILHHQRPGFLSYPSSHLVPYLRDRLFPVKRYPELYRERDVRVRMEAKIRRIYRRPPPSLARARTYAMDARRLRKPARIDAIITSPPYMNALDYVRDNRLRLWFLNRALPEVEDIPRRHREEHFRDLLRDTFGRLISRLTPGASVILIVGDTKRGTRRMDAAQTVRDIFAESEFRSLIPRGEIWDKIPDIRRSRRDLVGTKQETFLRYSVARPRTARRPGARNRAP